MAQEERNGVPTILNYLNEDCLRLVLQRVPVRDIIRSERVSRRWQRVVLGYLQTIRVGVHSTWYEKAPQKVSLLLREADWSSFKSWLKKPGPVVVSAYCSSMESFKIIGENCLFLEDVSFEGQLPEQLLQNNDYENFKRLRVVRFNYCGFPEHFIGQFIASPALETLEICFGNIERNLWSGHFLTNIKSTNWKSFILCYTIEGNEENQRINRFLSAAECFSELRYFMLKTDDEYFLEKLHLLLDRMPKLEHLEVDTYGIKLCNKFFKSVCKLRHLKYLNMEYYMCDENLEALAGSCPELRVLIVDYPAVNNPSAVTGKGLQAFGTRLTHFEALMLQSNTDELYIEDDAVVDFVRSCPSLKFLRLNTAYKLTVDMIPRAAAARRESGARAPLRLNLAATDIEGRPDLGEYEELILEFDW